MVKGLHYNLEALAFHVEPAFFRNVGVLKVQRIGRNTACTELVFLAADRNAIDVTIADRASSPVARLSPDAL